MDYLEGADIKKAYELLQKQQVVLDAEPWVSVINFVEKVNEEHPNTLVWALNEINYKNGTSEISITSVGEGKKIEIIGETISPESMRFVIKSMSENDIASAKYGTASLIAVSRSANDGYSSAVIRDIDESNVFEVIKKELLPNIDLKFNMEDPVFPSAKYEIALT